LRFTETKDSGRDLDLDNAEIAFNLLDFSVEPMGYDESFIITLSTELIG
jgi:hypothetical protein